MPEHILFLTGHLARASLCKVLQGMEPTEFTYEVRDIGISVAGLMTSEMLRRRLVPPIPATRIMVPGRCRGDMEGLSMHFGVPVVRGPEELKDIPRFFGRKGTDPDLSNHDVSIFAEIVDAPRLSLEAIVEQAGRYRRDGADVIDLGCLPDTPFPHLEDALRALKEAGYAVSVDSVDTGELLRGGRSGADYLLSLNEETLWIADEVPSTPILIPARPADMDSLERAVRALSARGRSFIADPILDPIHFGFTAAIVRYQRLREAFPEAPLMMGVGNVTELTDADTTGINALLMGIVSELRIGAILTTEVSAHTRSAVREADSARRMMYAARAADSLPRDFSNALLTVHSRRPFPDSPQEIAELAASIRDPSFRVRVSEAGIHVFNRDGHHVAIDPVALYSYLGLEHDGAHAFYMGIELARAQIAWQLGKRYAQDQELDWGCATIQPQPDDNAYAPAGATMLERNGRQTGS